MMPNPHEAPQLELLRGRINIFPDISTCRQIEGFGDGEKVVFISIGPGETHVTVVDDEGNSNEGWTAVFGWSSLCDIEIRHEGELLHSVNQSMIEKALRSSLRVYGVAIDTSEFIRKSRAHFSSAIRYIIDRTIGDARECDRIVLAAPAWMQQALSDCIRIRPHIDPEIRDL